MSVPIQNAGEPVTDAAIRIADRLHREGCGCKRMADAGWLWFGVAVADGELTYERALYLVGGSKSYVPADGGGS
jgi:hypothetical protein